MPDRAYIFDIDVQTTTLVLSAAHGARDWFMPA
jgi:hypothetical protein